LTHVSVRLCYTNAVLRCTRRADMDQRAAIYCIGTESKPIPKLPSKFSKLARSFVLVCMTRDPEMRPSASQLLKHGFVESRRRRTTNRRSWPPASPITVTAALRRCLQPRFDFGSTAIRRRYRPTSRSGCWTAA